MRKPRNILIAGLFVLSTAAVFCRGVVRFYPCGDGAVDLTDLSTLALRWLDPNCSYPDWCEGTDLNRSGAIGFNDFGLLAENWLWEDVAVNFDIDLDFADYAAFALNWLDIDCNELNPCGGFDFDESNRVDWPDFSEFTERWLSNMALDKVPELRDGQTSCKEITLYKILVAGLPEYAERWILEMGQFIDDRRIDSDEQDLLSYLAGVNDPLIYLTSPRIMDGDVNVADVNWVNHWQPEEGDYLYLDADLEQLDANALLISDIRPQLAALVAKAHNDFEIRKGLYLIFNYGHPPDKFSLSKYNTQLLMLCHLLHYGILEGQERLAVAAALDYGSLLTISQESLWPRIVEFVRHRLDYISETTTMLEEQGADWDPRHYPLAACIGLLWGSTSMDAHWHKCRLESYYAEQPMGSNDFELIFASANTMIEMRDWLIEKGIYSRKYELEKFVGRFPQLGSNYDSNTAAAAYMAIQEARQYELWHPDWLRYSVDWLWFYHKDSGLFTGSCGSWAVVASSLMRSLNIPALEQAHVHWHYRPQDDVWRICPRMLTSFLRKEKQNGESERFEIRSYYRVPWENHHFGETSEDSGKNRIWFYGTKSAGRVPEGIPSGYVFRKTLPPWWPDN